MPERAAMNRALDQIEHAVVLLKAVAHPLRLQIIGRLEAGEQTVTALCELTGAGQSHMSQQLNLLKARGILSARRAGNQVFYSIADCTVVEILKCTCCRRLPGPPGLRAPGRPTGPRRPTAPGRPSTPKRGSTRP